MALIILPLSALYLLVTDKETFDKYSEVIHKEKEPELSSFIEL